MFQIVKKNVKKYDSMITCLASLRVKLQLFYSRNNVHRLWQRLWAIIILAWTCMFPADSSPLRSPVSVRSFAVCVLPPPHLCTPPFPPLHSHSLFFLSHTFSWTIKLCVLFYWRLVLGIIVKSVFFQLWEVFYKFFGGIFVLSSVPIILINVAHLKVIYCFPFYLTPAFP